MSDAEEFDEFVQTGLELLPETDRERLQALYSICHGVSEQEHDKLHHTFLQDMHATLERQQPREPVAIPIIHATEHGEPVEVPITPADATTKPAKKSQAMLRRERGKRQEHKGELTVMTKHGVRRSVMESMLPNPRASVRSLRRKLVEQVAKMDNKKRAASSSSSTQNEVPLDVWLRSVRNGSGQN